MRSRRRWPRHDWEGFVVEAGRRTLWLRLWPDGRDWPELEVEYPRRLLRDAADGQLVHVVVRRNTLILDATPPPFTEAEIAEIWRKADERAALFRSFAE